MAKAKELPSLTLLGDDMEGRKNNMAEGSAPADVVIEEKPNTRKDAPKQKKSRGRKAGEKSDTLGIRPESPTVYLLPEEKLFIKKLKAHIMLETGDSIPDHKLIMDAVREYTKKHYADFINRTV